MDKDIEAPIDVNEAPYDYKIGIIIKVDGQYYCIDKRHGYPTLEGAKDELKKSNFRKFMMASDGVMRSFRKPMVPNSFGDAISVLRFNNI